MAFEKRTIAWHLWLAHSDGTPCADGCAEKADPKRMKVFAQLVHADDASPQEFYDRIEPVMESKLTSEFSEVERELFKIQWIEQMAKDLVVECGLPEPDYEMAKMQYEMYCDQEGWTGRDERIHSLRERAR